MGNIEGLVSAYARFVALPWSQGLSGPERVWMAIYPPREERRLRTRLGEFENETHKAGHGWYLHDVTDAFANWLGHHDYRESYFERPELLDPALERFAAVLAEHLKSVLVDSRVDENTVFALLGAGALFGLTRVSFLLEQVQSEVRGRLLVFFPGERHANNYRLLDARDGWNYMATPIEASEA
jgi:hypothetical protein